MTLDDLVASLPDVVGVGEAVPLQANLGAAASDSRRVDAATLFIALPGVRSQGTDHLEAAFAAGAPAALVPADAELAPALAARCVRVADVRRSGALAACALFGQPADSLLTFGVTGTNGKTSTCHILKHLLEQAGHRVVMLTTVAHEFEGWRCETPNTTPDAALLQSVLADAVSRGASAAVLEVSAHGVLLDRITGTRFDGLVFTNLSLDHQDFFDGIEPYFAEKLRLFTDAFYHKSGCVAAVGCDDAFGPRVLDAAIVPAVGFGEAADSVTHVSTAGIRLAPAGIEGEVVLGGERVAVATSLTSSFNRANLAGAAALAHRAGVQLAAIRQALMQPIAVPGRLMAVASNAPFRVIVDFAHTDSALGNLLAGLRAECEGRLIVVFGAGGDKDPARRRTLPQVVIERADVGVITLDNPRSEPPQAIIDTMVANWREIAAGRDLAPRLVVESDRRKAIAIALDEAGPGDIVVLAGKGHETTQIFADRVEHHDDHAIAVEWLGARYGLAA